MVIHDLLALRGIGFDQIDGEAVSSVVPRLVSEYRQMFERYLDREALIVGPGHQDGDADPARESPRAGARPARERGRRLRAVRDACVIVDFGTAINYDVVSGAGEYLGGIISPGHRDLDRGAHLAGRPAHEGRHQASRGR